MSLLKIVATYCLYISSTTANEVTSHKSDSHEIVNINNAFAANESLLHNN
ncbi:hypothetical protein PAUR_a2020 [Pseudoalteromonas aurantia 208]|uniref:Orphan protein n=1 Tax=Pseudoalteromonas aurantia 208 TaxID=1314867 RepID=A0ABR9EBT8_9GAMM|nr:hypothetical protein [Pseudoalteromonas aurantia 208]